MTFILVFILGSALGSFLNVLIDRLSTDKPFVGGRSYCEDCKKELQGLDIIPLISYLILKGKCRHCKKKIPFRLFVVEFLTGLFSVLIFLLFLQGVFSLPAALLIFLIIYAFFGIFVADIVYGIIPDLLVIASLLGSFFYVAVQGFPLQNHLLSAFGTIAFFFFLFIITKGKGMGLGDVKLSFVLGFLLGFPLIIVSLYIAFLTGAVISIILVICKKLRFFGSTIPFGPFLVASSVVALFYGREILTVFIANFL